MKLGEERNRHLAKRRRRPAKGGTGCKRPFEERVKVVIGFPYLRKEAPCRKKGMAYKDCGELDLRIKGGRGGDQHIVLRRSARRGNLGKRGMEKSATPSMRSLNR